MDSEGSFDFDPNTLVNNSGIHTVYVHLRRNKNPTDTETSYFTITVTVTDPVDCVPNLTLPTNIKAPQYSYDYQIG